MQLMKVSLLSLLLAISTFAGQAKVAPKSTADHLQDVSVTIRSENIFSAGEGSGVIFSRKDKVKICGNGRYLSKQCVCWFYNY